MRRSLFWLLASVGAVACVLPKAEIDESLGVAASSGTGGTAAGSGAGGSAGSGVAGIDPGGRGPGGGQGGGDFGLEAREFACDDYCTTYLKNCADAPPNTYDDKADCLTTCFTSDWPFGPEPLQQNSLQCRRTHAGLAATAQDPHCFHSAEFPTKTTCQLPPS